MFRSVSRLDGANFNIVNSDANPASNYALD